MADNKNLLRNLFTLLEGEVFYGDRLSQREFVTLMQPGQFVSPNLSENPASDDMQIQFALCDDLLDSQFLRAPLVGSVSGLYKEILDSAALPSVNLTPAEVKELAAVRVWLGTHETDYEIYRDRYFDVLAAFDQERYSQAPDPARMNRLQQKLTDAERTWDQRGYRADWNRKQGRLRYLLAGDPQVHWQDLDDQFSAHEQNSKRGRYYDTYLSPKPAEWLAPGTSWAKFDRMVSDSASSSYSRSTSWSAGGSVGWGLWSVGASAGGSSTYNRQSSDTSELSVSFEYLRVRITRPWLDANVFAARYWTWKRVHGYEQLSDGGNLGLNPPQRPLGRMPVLPTHFILARNVKLAARYEHNDQTLITSQSSGGGRLGYGPFSISGSYSESTSEKNVNGHVESGALVIEHPQIIGFCGTLLPRCPDANRTLPWGEDACFEEDTPYSRVAELEMARAAEYEEVTIEDSIESERMQLESALTAEVADIRVRAAAGAESRMGQRIRAAASRPL